MKNWEPKDWMVAAFLSVCGAGITWAMSIDGRVGKLEQAFIDVHEIVMRLDGANK